MYDQVVKCQRAGLCLSEHFLIIVCKHDSVPNDGWDFPWYKRTFECCRHFRFDPSAAALVLAGATSSAAEAKLCDQYTLVEVQPSSVGSKFESTSVGHVSRLQPGRV